MGREYHWDSEMVAYHMALKPRNEAKEKGSGSHAGTHDLQAIVRLGNRVGGYAYGLNPSLVW